jgi:MFS transporter, DHA2 family, multidrug resistance protein
VTEAASALAPVPRATRREWIGLAVLALPCLLYSMDLTVLNLAVPQISAQLRPSSSQLLWILDIYGFMIAGSLMTMGALGDRIGRRRLLMIGAAAFGVASVVAAFSTSAEMLIATRALLGVAGATLAPSTLSLIRNMFQEPRQRTVAISVWITSYSAGGAIGPLLGGVLLEHFWWGSVFLAGVPVMVLLLAVGPALLPEYRDPAARRPDLPSAALSLAAVLAVIYGLKRFAEGGASTLPAASIALGIAVGWLFVRRQRALADPLIDLAFFRAPAFTGSLAIYTLGTFIAFGAFLFVAQQLQLVLGLSPLHAGLGLLPFFAGFIAGSIATPVVVRRTHPAYAIAGGLVLAAAGFVVLAQVDAASGLAPLVAGSFAFSLGLSPVFTLTNDLVLGSVPAERAGAASGISETGSELGGALGIAVLGSIGTAVYRARMPDAVPGVPADALDAARATLGGAVAASEGLQGPAGADLLAAARGAFTESLGVTATICAVLAVGIAFLAVVLLRRVDFRPGH